ncbi:MAG: Rab family GTPase [Promethearchaeota archaeon]
MADAMFKICIFGDGGVGKTTLVNRYMNGVFKGDSTMTIGVDFHVKKLNISGLTVSLQIWDFAGEDRFRFLLPSYVIGASGGIFMYDITRYSSLKNYNDWLEIFTKAYKGNKQQIPVIMVGGKLDLQYKRAVDSNEAFELAKKSNLYGFVECSAKTGENVEDIFIEIGKLMMRKSDLI